MQIDWLAQTKLVAPRLREDLVPRQRLYDALNSLIHSHPLTLISAPPGYGKTTLLASLPVVFPGLPLTWISLGEEDNDPAHFLTVLLTALRRLKPDFGANMQAMLESYSNPAVDARRVIAVLINDVLESLGEVWVVMDDLHLISEPAVYGLVDGLLERLPPQMHLIIATRYDPPLALARLRARGQLAELRMSDLRFTADETRDFLNEKQCLKVSAEDIAQLQNRAEGWAAGLRLLAGSLDRIVTPEERRIFIQDLAQTNRYVFDFLAEEVLRRQEPETRAFLLRTSILPELTVPLCQAVTGRKDARMMLNRLYRRNLFLVQLDGSGQAFRYHALFAKFLQEQLEGESPEQVSHLHQLAGEALCREAPLRAIGHFLSAEQWEATAQIIEQPAVSEDLVRHGLLHTLRGWIEALPEATCAAHPRLLYLQGLCAIYIGAPDRALVFLEQARQALEWAGDAAGQGEVLLEMVNATNQLHDYPRQAVLTEQAMRFPLPPYGQVQLLVARAWQMIYEGNLQQADENLGRALEITLASDDVRAYQIIALLVNLQTAFLPSGPGRLEQYCRKVLAYFLDGIGPVQEGAHSVLGYTLLLRGDVDGAIAETEKALAIHQQIGGFPYTEAQTSFVQWLAFLVKGQYEAAEQVFLALIPWYERTPSLQPFLVTALYLIGRAYWMAHHWEQARQIETRIAGQENPQEYPEVAVSRRLMHALMEITDRHFVEAERTLLQAIAIEQLFPHAGLFGSPRVLLAYLYLQWDRERDAWSQFAPFLADCERKGLPGLILQEGLVALPLLRLAVARKAHVDFARRLLESLDVLEEHRLVTIPETGETLTPREVEVLQLIAAGASNQSIAKQLVISEHTVKVHITNLYAKLVVSSRTQAAARARELHIIS